MCILEEVTTLLERVCNGMHYLACIDFLFSLAQACRHKVTGWLAKKFKTPKLSEVHYNQCNSSSMTDAACAGVNFKPTTTHDASTQTDDVDKSVLAHLFKVLPINKQLEFLSTMFSEYMLVAFHVIVPEDFLGYTAKAMSQLRHSQRTNVMYNLAKGLGTQRADGSDSRFPTKCMPMGLIEYAVDFFANDNLQQVRMPAVLVHILLSLSQISCPPDYRLWQQTMYCHFGQKWAKLHHGPLWSVVPSVSTDPNERNPNNCNTMQVRKNITVTICEKPLL